MVHAEAWGEHIKRREAWVKQINELIAELQRKGRGRKSGHTVREPKQFSADAAPGDFLVDRTGTSTDSTRGVARESIGFTIWWPSPADNPDATARANAIRVRVHVELLTDYATISFFMDVGRQADSTMAYRVSDAKGERRRSILQAAEAVRDICERQMASVEGSSTAAVDEPALPEKLGPGEAEALKASRKILYVDMWEDFRSEMGVSLATIAGNRGDVFANFCGLVLETGGLPDPGIPPERAAAMGTRPFPVFDGDFSMSGEANAVVKAFWPFVRRVTPLADHREFTASGVLGWRAIYITALGSKSQYDVDEERDEAESDVSESSILRHRSGERVYVDHMVERREGSESDGYNHPVRYLILTKCQPHPRQIGRIVDRINALGTLRLFALKDWAAIRDADPHIRILGQELDQVIHQWGVRKRNIELLRTPAQIRWAARAQPNTFAPIDGAKIFAVPELREIDAPFERTATLGQMLWVTLLAVMSLRRARAYRLQISKNSVEDIRHDCLYVLTRDMDRQLVQLGALLDDLGRRASGGFHFRLNRSAYYIEEFRILLETLQVGNIPSWISYKQFVVRGLSPTFDYIESVGRRLASLRARLQGVIAAIETSALVVQSAATRHNTAELRKIVQLGRVVGGGGVVFLLLKILQMLGLKGIF